MASKRPDFDELSDPIEDRIAAGLHKLGLAMKHQTWVQANDEGLSPTQGQILALLSAEGPKTGAELAKSLGLKPPTVSESAAVLVDKGLVRRKPDPRHPRASLLELTASGAKRARSVRTWPEFLASAVASLSASERESFLTGIMKMIQSLLAAGQIPTARMCPSCVHFQPFKHEGPRPHHCALVGAPMSNVHLRIDCGEHEAAPKGRAEETWARFSGRA